MFKNYLQDLNRSGDLNAVLGLLIYVSILSNQTISFLELLNLSFILLKNEKLI